MRQFLTPEVWKQVKQVASQHGCRNGVRWTLTPHHDCSDYDLVCRGKGRRPFCAVPLLLRPDSLPQRQRPGKAFSGFCKAMLRLPMPVWWAFCDVVRSRLFHLLADRMTMEWLPLGCDGSRMECSHGGVGTELGEVQQGQIGTDTLGDRLGQLDHWGTLVLALGDIQNGGTSLPDRSVGDAPPSGPPKRALGLRRGLRGLRLVWSVAEAAVLLSDPALFAGTT